MVADVKHFGLEKETTLEVYVPIVPGAGPDDDLAGQQHVLGDRDDWRAAGGANAVRREIAAIDPAVPASFVRSMDQWLGVSIAPRRFNLEVVAAFAAGGASSGGDRGLCRLRGGRRPANAGDRHPQRARRLESAGHPARASEGSATGVARPDRRMAGALFSGGRSPACCSASLPTIRSRSRSSRSR